MSTTVLGAGYAGIMAANRLAGQGEPVTLVSPSPWFVERIRLHLVAAGTRASARRELAELLHPSIEAVTDTAIRIDAGEIHLASGAVRRFDTLIYAVGSGSPSPIGPFRVASEEEAEGLRDELRTRPNALVTVVGAGLTGVELAGALAAAGRRVRIVTASRPTRRAADHHLRYLRKRGVEVEYATHARVADSSDKIVIDATGFTVPTLAADSGLPVGSDGRLIVDEMLRVPGHPNILGAGDAVHVDGAMGDRLRPACATAMPMGAHAADVILADRKRTSAPACAMGSMLQCGDLGAGRGRVQMVRPDDSERRFAFNGRFGGLLKETVCRMTVRWLAQERVSAGKYSWPGQPK